MVLLGVPEQSTRGASDPSRSQPWGLEGCRATAGDGRVYRSGGAGSDWLEKGVAGGGRADIASSGGRGRDLVVYRTPRTRPVAFRWMVVRFRSPRNSSS